KGTNMVCRVPDVADIVGKCLEGVARGMGGSIDDLGLIDPTHIGVEPLFVRGAVFIDLGEVGKGKNRSRITCKGALEFGEAVGTEDLVDVELDEYIPFGGR